MPRSSTGSRGWPAWPWGAVACGSSAPPASSSSPMAIVLRRDGPPPQTATSRPGGGPPRCRSSTASPSRPTATTPSPTAWPGGPTAGSTADVARVPRGISAGQGPSHTRACRCAGGSGATTPSGRFSRRFAMERRIPGASTGTTSATGSSPTPSMATCGASFPAPITPAPTPSSRTPGCSSHSGPTPTMTTSTRGGTGPSRAMAVPMPMAGAMPTPAA